MKTTLLLLLVLLLPNVGFAADHKPSASITGFITEKNAYQFKNIMTDNYKATLKWNADGFDMELTYKYMPLELAAYFDSESAAKSPTFTMTFLDKGGFEVLKNVVCAYGNFTVLGGGKMIRRTAVYKGHILCSEEAYPRISSIVTYYTK